MDLVFRSICFVSFCDFGIINVEFIKTKETQSHKKASFLKINKCIH